ncbi:MAG TPA: shikimate dehydrogenase [Rhizomicrobium sp.]|jgi:shikimate dehydrogenase|nr:shikimate dehydrogenase [Rhizomicrobium sp.]
MSGKAKVAGVIGWPVGHSLSPVLHGFWLDAHKVDGAYVPLAVAPENLSIVLDGLRHSGFKGVNLTVPHKEAGFALVHETDEAAQIAGAVNLLIFGERGRLIGRNTDAMGLAASLRDANTNITGAAAVLLGAGGAARAGVLALDALGAKEIRILNRNISRAEATAASLAPKLKTRLTVGSLTDWPNAVHDSKLLLNTTSAGMKGNEALNLDLALLPNDAAVCDIVYNPLETDLLARAKARGLKTIDGLGMLMYQAVPAFEAFYGVMPQVTPELRRHLEAALT